MQIIKKQSGMALFVSLIFLLLLTIFGVAAMQNAGVQEKMAGNVKLKNETFQLAERALREGENYILDVAHEGDLATCDECVGDNCRVPAITGGLVETDGVCDVWRSAASGNTFYQLQKLGGSSAAVNVQVGSSVVLYRVTAVSYQGNARTALESIYAHSN
ncbi:PilX N-terminal domain-containing pilus assembly protein [Pseudomonas sp. R-28-1W-6]|jgi:type IV pilus assembly protein PilX|uniref:pilus assembly PilX family protein n=1 Tax=Pseudomonas sp. R-28-1W-6 TaxID=2650101 RepID=UPI00211599E9|nr:PilX N-terminal domain-containing pilus assembly protein [Pseudomonas sp. R-28-1W-6]